MSFIIQFFLSEILGGIVNKFRHHRFVASRLLRHDHFSFIITVVVIAGVTNFLVHPLILRRWFRPFGFLEVVFCSRSVNLNLTLNLSLFASDDIFVFLTVYSKIRRWLFLKQSCHFDFWFVFDNTTFLSLGSEVFSAATGSFDGIHVKIRRQETFVQLGHGIVFFVPKSLSRGNLSVLRIEI